MGADISSAKPPFSFAELTARIPIDAAPRAVGSKTRRSAELRIREILLRREVAAHYSNCR
jgi:hypothetical protein